MSNKELYELAEDAFNTMMENALDLTNVKYLGCEKGEEWSTYHEVIVFWTCDEMEYGITETYEDYSEFLIDFDIEETIELNGITFVLA